MIYKNVKKRALCKTKLFLVLFQADLHHYSSACICEWCTHLPPQQSSLCAMSHHHQPPPPLFTQKKQRDHQQLGKHPLEKKSAFRDV